MGSFANCPQNEERSEHTWDRPEAEDPLCYSTLPELGHYWVHWHDHEPVLSETWPKLPPESSALCNNVRMWTGHCYWSDSNQAPVPREAFHLNGPPRCVSWRWTVATRRLSEDSAQRLARAADRGSFCHLAEGQGRDLHCCPQQKAGRLGDILDVSFQSQLTVVFW